MAARLHCPAPGRSSGLALVVAATLGLAGCVGIPTSGPVTEGGVAVGEVGAPLGLAVDPIEDGSPEEIVAGFLAAGAAGLQDEFVVARTFLTTRASDTWDPRTQVLVFASPGPGAEERADGVVVVTVPVAGVVDATGVYTEAAQGAPHTLEFTLVQDTAQQWRISQLSDGVVMSPRDFAQLYRAAPVYFASRDGSHLIPDLRHFPSSNMPTSAVSALLDGPSTWLRDAVVSGAPEGMQLSISAVTVSETVASVDLASPAALARADRNLLKAQLEATLGSLPTVITEVTVTVGGVPWLADEELELTVDPGPSAGPYVLVDDKLSLVEQGSVTPVPDAASLGGLGAHHPAIGPDGDPRVVLSGTSRLMLLPVGGDAPVELLSGSRLVPPSVDRFGWVWTGEAETGALIAVAPELGESAALGADWLEGSTVRSVRVARDGSRVAIISVDAGERATVDVAAVLRDETGRPQRLGEPRQVGATLTDATQVSWVDEVTVAVLGTSGPSGSPQMHLVPIGGPTTSLPLVAETALIATGRGDRAQYLVDEQGQLWQRQVTGWTVVTDGVRDVAFPG